MKAWTSEVFLEEWKLVSSKALQISYELSTFSDATFLSCSTFSCIHNYNRNRQTNREHSVSRCFSSNMQAWISEMLSDKRHLHTLLYLQKHYKWQNKLSTFNNSISFSRSSIFFCTYITKEVDKITESTTY